MVDNPLISPPTEDLSIRPSSPGLVNITPAATAASASDFARVVRQQSEKYSTLKIYRCPMAPKPGLWIQLKEPLRNPFFGEEMLDCGNEVKE